MGCCVSSSNQRENPNSGNDDHHDGRRTNVELPEYPLPLPPAGGTAPSQPPAGGTEPPQPPAEGTVQSQPPDEETPPFPGFPLLTLAELKAATNGFSLQNMLSKGGDELPNFVYRGRLHGSQKIVVKRFSMVAWPDAEEFKEEAIRVGKLRHRRVANLIGYCCEGDERLLVAEFMPNDTLAKHLSKFKTMERSRRLRVACYIAEALEHCINEGQTLYHDLNSNNVLFDEAGNPCLSCFGLVKNSRDGRSYSTDIAYMPPECLNGRVTPESMIFSFGIVLRDLLSGKQISEDDALDMTMGIQIPTFMDSRLKGEYSFEEAAALMKLTSRCLCNNPNDRPTIKEVNAILAQVQSNAGAPSDAMPGTQEKDKMPPMPGSQQQDKTSPVRGTQKQDKTLPRLSNPKQNTTPPIQGTQKQNKIPQTPPIPQPTSFPMAEAVARVDLAAIHQILVLACYKGDEATREFHLKDWTPHMREMLKARKRGDSAFNDKDFKTAIKCYSRFLDEGKLVSATVRVRRSLCYLMSAQPDKALCDAMQAQRIQSNWPTAFYMLAVALCQLNMNCDSADMLKEATGLEKRKLMNTR